MGSIATPVANGINGHNGHSVDNSHVDVLIVGAGPMGLMSALWMAEFGLKIRIIDERGTRALNGRADGFHVRSLEIWDSFGLGHIFANHGTPFSRWALWAPNSEGKLTRQKQEGAIGIDVSRFICGTIHQGNVEAALIDAAKRRSSIEVERGVVPTRIAVDDSKIDDHTAYAVTVDLRRVQKEELTTWAVNAHSVKDGVVKTERGHIDATVVPNDGSDTIPTISGEPGSTETVHAKYVIGADGAHSWVRRQLGLHMEGASHNAQWGVIDVVLNTDFPDLQKHCTILSPVGTVLSVPRENGLTRLYIQLPGSDQDVSPVSGIATAQHMMESAAKIIAPYRLSYSYCDWWTVYKVGQRVANHFHYGQRVFLGGDAVHTHTPKGGQGMNVSMQDAYNLGWKLAGVLKNQLDPAILSTYETERRPIAQLLIDIDRMLAGNLSKKDRTTTLGVNEVYDKLRQFNSGANICYEPSAIVATQPPVPVTNLPLGMRMPPYPIFNLASALPVDLQGLFRSNGQWRLLVFGGDVTNETQLSRVNKLGAALSPLLGKFRPLKSGVPFLVPLLLIWAGCEQMELSAFHDIFSRLEDDSNFEYNRIFADPPATKKSGRAESAHVAFDVSVGKGCMILVRPDQCISWVGELDGVAALEEFLGGIFLSK
ncbi:FAD binding domain-containing protein [Hypoxylon crocopeplum]|nr:FAD binding domain-containing protein [Hypoxylon crocopeplum]